MARSGPRAQRASTALDIAILRESMKESLANIRWVDGKRHQITDPLTKRNGCADLLRGILQKGEFVIVEEDRALKLREGERDARVAIRGAFGRRLDPAAPTAELSGTATNPAETDI